MHETKARSIAKALTWRFIATLTTTGLALYFTGELQTAMTIGVFDVVIKLLFYYFHERGWGSVDWGFHPVDVTEISY